MDISAFFFSWTRLQACIYFTFYQPKSEAEAFLYTLNHQRFEPYSEYFVDDNVARSRSSVTLKNKIAWFLILKFAPDKQISR